MAGSLIYDSLAGLDQRCADYWFSQQSCKCHCYARLVKEPQLGLKMGCAKTLNTAAMSCESSPMIRGGTRAGRFLDHRSTAVVHSKICYAQQNLLRILNAPLSRTAKSIVPSFEPGRNSTPLKVEPKMFPARYLLR